MSTALYRRYRSARFGDLIGQDQIAATLRNQVRSGNLAHAYLFTGIRGTGKTSAARILARAINCVKPDDGEPCNECPACVEILGGGAVDVLEIDAASNRGIDEIRSLREKVNYLPASVARKVYIIDEAHMLTAPAWNAFLKTLEEPPAHVVFVLATTEPHEVPETIRSRVQRFDFRRVERADIAAHLGRIAHSEDVVVSADALDLLATAGQGSVRDALSLLDQAMSSGVRPLDLEAARRALGLADPAIVRGIIEAVAAYDAASALRGAALAFDAGADPRQLVRELARLVRGAALAGVGYAQGADLGAEDAATCEQLGRGVAAGTWVTALELLNTTERDLRQPVDARLQVEHCLLRLTHPATSSAGADVAVLQALSARLDRLEAALPPTPAPPAVAAAPVVAAPPPPVPAPPVIDEPASAAAEPPRPVEPATVGVASAVAVAPVAAGSQPADITAWTAVWAQLVEAVNRRDSMLAGVLRDCRPLEASPGRLIVGAPYSFHLDRINDPIKHKVLVDAVAEIGGAPHEVEAKFCGEDRPAAATSGGQSDVTRAALDAFKGSRITTSRLRDER